MKKSNTRDWLNECRMRHADKSDDPTITITVGEFKSLVDQGFKMMDFADQLITCQIEINRLEKMTDSDSDRA